MLNAEETEKVCEEIYLFTPQEVESNPKLSEIVSKSTESTKNNAKRVYNDFKVPISGSEENNPQKEETGKKRKNSRTRKSILVTQKINWD
ncbi:hypothetical protein JTB14_003586 [Gonioctena quinquepunctata]|nr:hypothetical protein JTB14_003586 [Gonioctena quinquepunctata]